jgi:hypothetical protein
MGSGFRVQGSGFRVQGSGLRVTGIGYRVTGLGSRVLNISDKSYKLGGGACQPAEVEVTGRGGGNWPRGRRRSLTEADDRAHGGEGGSERRDQLLHGLVAIQNSYWASGKHHVESPTPPPTPPHQQRVVESRAATSMQVLDSRQRAELYPAYKTMAMYTHPIYEHPPARRVRQSLWWGDST